MRLSDSMVATLAQELVPREDVAGRTAAIEIMMVTPTIQQYIEDGATSDIEDAIFEGSHWGMQTMNQSLLHYYEQGVISPETAQFYAGNATEMRQMLRRMDKEHEDAQRVAEQKKRRVSKAER
ncbi:MAG: type IV pili twitching motility protein PilT, partial [Armatimonadetes bacterium]|nr:type IV pili twitching motility protein PilT [Armatimonadota bacterium]